MSASPVFDLAIIGSGPGGYRAAVLGAQRGLKVAVIERHTWGGTCLNRGCVPKKAWHHTAQLLAASRHAERGLHGGLAPDLAQAWRHQSQVAATVRAGYADYLGRMGIASFDGNAQLAGAHTIVIDGDARIEARHVVVATGSRPVFPAALPATPGRILSTDELFDAPPPAGKRLAIAGSGVIGTEFAFILAMLGLQVTWICRAEPLAGARFSPAARRTLAAELARHGIAARVGARAAAADIDDRGVRLRLEDGAEFEVDWVLAASGRRPNSDGLGLEALGVEIDRDGFIGVDARRRTRVPHIYAIGDVASREMSANQALVQAGVAIADILAPDSARHDPLAVPFLVYSATVLGRLGRSEDEAEEAGFDPAVGYAAFEANPRALGQDDTAGFVRVLADHDSGDLLGAEIVGAEAGELINLVTQAYGRPDALMRLAAAPYNHPARAEEILNAVEALATKWGLADKIYARKKFSPGE